jgi:hypothetical protein
MSRWRAIVIGAVTGGALALAGAGCGSGQPGATGAGTAAPKSPAATSRPAGASSSPGAPTSASPGSTAAAYLQSSALVPFTGDAVTFTVQAARPGSLQWIRVAAATVALGDGTTQTVTGHCAGASLPPPSAGLLVRHAYRRAGVMSPHVTAETLCGQPSSAPAPNLVGASVSLRVLPAAPSASASWPQCSTAQIAITATGTGAGLGHIGVLFLLRNSSAVSCRLYGYPGLQLLGSADQALPTTVVRAAGGAYLFPAVVPHWVALPPGAVGSFDLEYEDNPTGAAASEPYATACPAATQVEVTLPNAYTHAVVPASMAPCEGQVLVSPVVPGTQWLTT